MYHMGEGTRSGPFPITENRQGRVTEPKGDQFSCRNLGMIPYVLEMATSTIKSKVNCKTQARLTQKYHYSTPYNDHHDQ